MIAFQVFFKNHFNTKEISDVKLQSFAEFHIQGLLANNPGGIYDLLISETTLAYTNYFGSITDKATAIAIRKGKTVAMQDAMLIFKTFVSRQEGLVRSKWSVDSAEYQEFYPHGIYEYTKATLATIEIIMVRYKKQWTRMPQILVPHS